jgi:hypothetical protein
MKKLAAFLVFGAVLAAGLAGQAADLVVQVSCDTSNNVLGTTISSGVTLPTACAVGNGCSQCFAVLLSNRFFMAFDYANTPNASTPATSTIQSQAIFLR